MTEQQSVAILGLGAMGTRIAYRLIDAGLAVTVWNRTSAVADALAKTGARIAASPLAAARGAEVVISMVYDDDASRSVWLGPRRGKNGRTPVSFTFTSIRPTLQRERTVGSGKAVSRSGATHLCPTHDRSSVKARPGAMRVVS
jgi:3-hydroxyisobutyrate dehydrogenase